MVRDYFFFFPWPIPLHGQKCLEVLSALALGPQDRWRKLRNPHPLHMAESLVKCEFWKFRVPEREMAEILAGPIFTAKSRHRSELSKKAGDWRSTLWSRPTKLAIHEIQTEEQICVSLPGKIGV